MEEWEEGERRRGINPHLFQEDCADITITVAVDTRTCSCARACLCASPSLDCNKTKHFFNTVTKLDHVILLPHTKGN